MRSGVSVGRAGARVEEAQPEGFGDMRRHHELYTSTLSRISSLRETEARRTRMAENMRSRGGMFGETMARGMEATASGYVSWLSAREGFREAYREFFRAWDVLLAPITVVPPFPHTDARWPERRLDVNNESVEYGLQTVYPGVATFCGQPATAFPRGQTRSGLPIGLQAIGPYLEDRTSIRFAELVSREFGGFQAPPGYGGGW